ncbi:MAG: hypothetical protein JXB07_07150 [Anaerolineae bacterium]|nr:hypothetical protein [Anaerolineae bacterium]
MFQHFINSLAENAADIVTWLVIIGISALLLLYLRARSRHIRRLRAHLNGEMSIPGQLKDVLAKILNVNAAEFTTIGAVTFVDVAWHYSMADPHIWDHFQGPAADHMADVIQNLDVLKSSLGDQAHHILDNVLGYFQGMEATQVFHDMIDHLSVAGSAADAATLALDAPADSLVDSLSQASNVATTGIEAKATAVGDSGLLFHIPMITLGFATYRAWRRAQKGAGLGRNLEFAAIEVTTRAGGGLVGGQLGGAVGTAVAPGVGTIVGGIAGAVAGAIGGALLGEEFKQRHIKQAQDKFNATLDELGVTYLQHPGRFRDLTDVFTEQERSYERNLRSMQRRLLHYQLLPWRVAWPDQKLVLLQETVKMARERLTTLKKGTIEAVDQLTYMRDRKQYRQMGVILWSDPALRQQLDCDPRLIGPIEQAHNQLLHEVGQIGVKTQRATA